MAQTWAPADVELELACNVGAYEWRPAEDRLEWSAGLVRIYGLTQAPTAEVGFSSLVHPADRTRVEAETSAFLGSRETAYSHSFRIVRPDGAVRFVLDRGVIERDASGAVRVMRGFNVDLTPDDPLPPRLESGPALRVSDERYRELADAMPQLVWIADSDGVVRYYNARVAEYRLTVKSSPPNYDWAVAIHPDEFDETWAAWRQAVAGGKTYEMAHRMLMADGAYRWHLSRGLPQRNDAGAVVAWFGSSTDVEELHGMHGRQKVLVAELQHRTRNLIGVVRSVADRTIAHSADLAEFRLAYLDRLDALSRVQRLLSRLGEGERITFDELIRSELDIVGDRLGRVALDGPGGVALRSSSVQIVAMAVHELTTNAIKYGAFSQPQARLEVRWRLERRDGDLQPWLRVDWRERDVVVGATPAAQGGGCGRELIERALPHQLGAETQYALESDGVHCVLALPVCGPPSEEGEG